MFFPKAQMLNHVFLRPRARVMHEQLTRAAKSNNASGDGMETGSGSILLMERHKVSRLLICHGMGMSNQECSRTFLKSLFTCGEATRSWKGQSCGLGHGERDCDSTSKEIYLKRSFIMQSS